MLMSFDICGMEEHTFSVFIHGNLILEVTQTKVILKTK